MNIDSIVLQVQGNEDQIAEEINMMLDGKLEILKSLPRQPTKEQRSEWLRVTRRLFPKTAVFVAFIHHERGQSIPLIKYGNSKGLTLHFNGLHSITREEYNITDYAKQRIIILNEFLNKWNEEIKVTRVDYCIDFIDKKWDEYSNTRLHRQLCKKHGAAKFKKTTVYYQPPKPKYVKITAYDKQVKNGLNYPITRVEFSFMGQFWSNFDTRYGNKVVYDALEKVERFLIHRNLSKLYKKNIHLELL